jgi:hypothetical protein
MSGLAAVRQAASAAKFLLLWYAARLPPKMLKRVVSAPLERVDEAGRAKNTSPPNVS